MDSAELRKLRGKSRLLINEVANAIDVPIQTVAEWENGIEQIPTDKQMQLRFVFQHAERYMRYTFIVGYDDMQKILEHMPKLKECMVEYKEKAR